MISGTPTATGTSNFTVKVTDKNSQTATQTLSIVVNAGISITTNSLPNGNVKYYLQHHARRERRNDALQRSISTGTLPAGLSLAPNTGIISGTPTATGTSNFTVQVTDHNSQTEILQALSIVVSAGVGNHHQLASERHGKYDLQHNARRKRRHNALHVVGFRRNATRGLVARPEHRRHLRHADGNWYEQLHCKGD